MYKKITLTYDFNRNQEKAEKEFPFPLGHIDHNIDGSWDNLTINQMLDLCLRVHKMDLKNIHIYRGEKEIFIDYSRPYNEVVTLLNENIIEYRLHINKVINKVETEVDGKKVVTNDTQYNKVKCEIFVKE